MAFCICLVYRRWSALFGDAIELIVTERVAIHNYILDG
jgi:hypothetical protein